MKIGILTFHCAANYGAVLQTYCLQEVLKKMGHDVYVIDYRPKYLIEPYKIFSYYSDLYSSYLAKIKGFIRSFLVAPIRWKRNRSFSKFVNHYLNLYQLDLNNESNDFDAFVFGSDQIWNPKLTDGFDKVYLGDFPAAKGKKLIAFAASAGSVLNLSSGNIDYFLSRLKCFDKIFVRERSLADYINQNISHVAEVVLDPVMLGGMPVLNTLLPTANKRISADRPYLLLFQLYRNDEVAEYAVNFANKKGFDIVELAAMEESLFNRKMKQTLCVEELLWYIEQSSYIITTSFHITVLAILLKKQFNTVSMARDFDERALLLLKGLSLNDRMITLDSIDNGENIDYSKVESLRIKKVYEVIELLKNIVIV